MFCSEFAPSDVGKYGFKRWNPPDTGANQDPPQAGGGTYDNDGRYMNSAGDAASGNEGALRYLNSCAAQQQPFFMVISLVNPHDVLFYPRSTSTPATTTRGCRERSGFLRRSAKTS